MCTSFIQILTQRLLKYLKSLSFWRNYRKISQTNFYLKISVICIKFALKRPVVSFKFLCNNLIDRLLKSRKKIRFRWIEHFLPNELSFIEFPSLLIPSLRLPSIEPLVNLLRPYRRHHEASETLIPTLAKQSRINPANDATNNKTR